MELTLQVDFEEGDILIFNDSEYKIRDIDNHTGTITWKKAGIDEIEHTTREDIEEFIQFSGKFTLIREEYVSTFQA